ncbi:MAG: M56 family metallopeptidase [Cyanobacteria bacterium J06642_9]
MHLTMVIFIIMLAWMIRAMVSPDPGNSPHRWGESLLSFVVPPLLLLTTALSIVCMGPRGNMVVPWEGWFSYGLAWAFLATSVALLLYLAWRSGLALYQIHTLPEASVQGMAARLLTTDLPYSAQVGFWQPHLVVSQGLLQQLDPDHLASVVIHEQAHAYYHDTFWCFWLGWLKRLTFWLPHSQTLWEEITFLRELRADAWATQRINRFILAESLVQVAKSPWITDDIISVPFSCATAQGRLAQRIDLLLTEAHPLAEPRPLPWLAIAPVLIPLLMIPFHH